MIGGSYSWLSPERGAQIALEAYRIAAWGAQQEEFDPSDWISDQGRRESFAEDLGSRFVALVTREAIGRGTCWPGWTSGLEDAAAASMALAEVPVGWQP